MKKQLSIILAIVMLFTVIGSMQIANAESEPIEILTVKDQIRTVGRTEEVDNGIACDWTASGIEFNAVCEENSSIALTINSNAECYFTVFIDDVRQDYRVRTLSGDYTPVFASAENGLESGKHKIKIIKQTERSNVKTTIKAISLNNVVLSDKPEEPEYIFEMVGDSITSGFGSLDTNNQEAKYSDGTRTYAYLTAQNFGAEARVVSQSGGFITSLYNQYIKNSRDDNAFDYSAYKKPNVVTLAFGTNDGSRTVEYWQTGIQNFADAIRTGYNDNSIPIVFIHNLISNDDKLRANVATAIKNLKAEDETKYSNIYVTSGNNPQGGHPGQQSHYKTSKKLTRDLVEFGLMPASALKDDATIILNESSQKEITVNNFDSNITAVDGITSELVSPLDPADNGVDGKYAVKFTADGTQTEVADKNTLHATFGTVANTNYKTKGISFYLKYHDTDYDSSDETSVYDIPRLYFVNGNGDSTAYDLYSVKLSDVKDNELTKVEIYWNEMPYSNYIFLRSFINCNSVKLCLDMHGECEYTIDNMQAILCDYTYSDNSNQAYTYTKGYSSYEVIGILDGYEAATTVTSATSATTTTSTATTTKGTETSSSASSATDSEYTKVLDFDTTLTEPVFGWQNGTDKSSVIDYTTVDETYADGNVAMLASSNNYNNVGFLLGDVFSGKKVKSISFEIWSTTAFNLDNRSGLRNGTNYADPEIDMRNLGYNDSKKFLITKEKQNLIFDFSNISVDVTAWTNPHVSFNLSKTTTLYIDNITVTYERYYADLDVEGNVERVYADENGYITLPDVAISTGDFAGWATDDDADNIIPANTSLNISKDTVFYAVSSNRLDQEAPGAPVVKSVGATTVTLVANDSYQYSMDGTVWQNSNIFTGLDSATEYTFYQRYKATATHKSSPASEGLKVTTATVYNFEAEKTVGAYSGTLNSNSSNSDTSTGSLIYAVHDASNPAVGHYVEYKFTGITTGYYQVSLFSRNVSGSRSTYEVTAFDETNSQQSAGSINFADLSTKVGNNTYYCNPTLTENVLVSSGSTLKLRFTITAAGTSSGSYIDKFVLTKVADYIPEETGDTTDALSTSATASIRLGTVCGIRFYTTFDTSKIEGTIVEKGTLIGPKDKIGNYLTIEDTVTEDGASPKAVTVKYKPDTLWENNEFVGSLVGIKETNYNREFVARGYVKLEDGTYLYSATSTAKTVADIAAAFIENATKDDATEKDKALYNTYKELVDKWAATKS